MKFYHILSPAIIGAALVVIQPHISMAMSEAEVAKVAQEITVKIQKINSEKGSGSGVIIKGDGNTYTVLTAAHVVGNETLKYEIVAPDGKRYPVNNIKYPPDSEGLDLAVVQFTSNGKYSVAKIGNSDNATGGTTSYVAGFPGSSTGEKKSNYNFLSGKITANSVKAPEISANSSKALKSGYSMIYNNGTVPGMSGGSVLNDRGELIAIHGEADINQIAVENNPKIVLKTGFNFGIPTNTALRFLLKTGVDVGVRPPNATVATVPKADDFYLQGSYKSGAGDMQGAITDFKQALKINPNYPEAYNNLGVIYYKLGEKQEAIANYTQALKVDPNHILAYQNRGVARADLGDKQGAIDDYNQSIKINPKNAEAYTNRGNARSELGDKQGAIADYTQAININPNIAQTYDNRGQNRYDLEDLQGAISDYNQALKINPNYAPAYASRGNARYLLGDKQGAINDFNQALKINPNFAIAYHNRGGFYYLSGDKQRAINDFNQAIKLNPNFAKTYHLRGLARAELGDKQAAISDLQKAAELFQQQGDAGNYQQALALIARIQGTGGSADSIPYRRAGERR
jgi:tetratricopeptide (TPR) repeat protein